MTLFKLNSASTILIEEDCEKNVLPVLVHLVQNSKDATLNVINYEQPALVWRNVFKGISYKCFEGQSLKDVYKPAANKSIYLVDSVNQMALTMGWNKCLRYLKQIQQDQNVVKLIFILHKDCLPINSKLQVNLNHIANATITYDNSDIQKVYIQIKKGGKFTKSEEIITYDSRNQLVTLCPVPRIDKKSEEPEKIMPNILTTFKIETDQSQQLEKYQLKLPYMSKINEGQGKVYYEPDAVDDWDEEDPDEDLDI